MDIFKLPINKELQMQKVIEDTEEIINNFTKSSKITIKNYGAIESKINRKNDNTMYNLGNKLINYKEEKENPDENIGNDQIGLL